MSNQVAFPEYFGKTMFTNPCSCAYLKMQYSAKAEVYPLQEKPTFTFPSVAIFNLHFEVEQEHGLEKLYILPPDVIRWFPELVFLGSVRYPLEISNISEMSPVASVHVYIELKVDINLFK